MRQMAGARQAAVVLRRGDRQRPRAATRATAAGSSSAAGVSTVMAPSYRFARAAANPCRSDPAIGWLPMKRAAHPRSASRQARSSHSLVLPTSVQSAPDAAAGAAAASAAGMSRTGNAATISVAPRAAPAGVSNTSSAAPAARAAARVSARRA